MLRKEKTLSLKSNKREPNYELVKVVGKDIRKKLN